MKKLGCAKCGGVKKMKLGGSAVAKAPVNMYGIPQENMGTSSQMGFGRNGGSVKKPLAKARVGMSTGPGKPKTAVQGVKDFGKYVSTFGGATEKKSNVSKNKKTGMDALKDLGKYVSTFGLATEKYNPAPKKTAVKTKKK